MLIAMGSHQARENMLGNAVERHRRSPRAAARGGLGAFDEAVAALAAVCRTQPEGF